MTFRRLGLVLTAALLVTGEFVGQDPVADFMVAYEHAERLRLAEKTQPAAVHAAFERVEAAFAIVPDSDRAEWLAHAGHAAFHSGQFSLAATRFAAALDALGATDYLVEHRLLALRWSSEFDTMLRESWIRFAERPDLVTRVVGGQTGAGIPGLHTAADLALRTGDHELAVWHFSRIVESSGGSGIALGNLALTLRSLGESERCDATYRRALAVAPDDSVLWNDYGLFLRGVGRLEEALVALRESLAREPEPKGGPAIGNLIDLQRAGVTVGIDDPARALVPVLKSLPDRAQLSRRRCLDAILGR